MKYSLLACLTVAMLAIACPAAFGQQFPPPTYEPTGVPRTAATGPKITSGLEYPRPEPEEYVAITAKALDRPATTLKSTTRTNDKPAIKAGKEKAKAVARLEPKPDTQLTTVEQRAGKASRDQEDAEQSVREETSKLLKDMKLAIAGYDMNPRWDAADEALRLEHFSRLLDHAIVLGKRAGADKVAFEQSVTRWSAVSKDSAPVFHEAEAAFRKLAKEAEFAEEKKLLEGAAEYYSARAVRAEFHAAHVIPQDVTTQLRRIGKMTKALEVLHGYVKADPYYLKKNSEADANIVAFTEAFNGINNVLSEWTTKLLDDMEKVDEPAKGDTASMKGTQTR